MSLNLYHKHGDNLIVDVIDDTVMGGDMPRPGDILPTLQRLRVAEACAWVIHQLMVDLLIFLPKLRIGFLPLSDDLIRVCRYFNLVHDYMDSK